VKTTTGGSGQKVTISPLHLIIYNDFLGLHAFSHNFTAEVFQDLRQGLGIYPERIP